MLQKKSILQNGTSKKLMSIKLKQKNREADVMKKRVYEVRLLSRLQAR